MGQRLASVDIMCPQDPKKIPELQGGTLPAINGVITPMNGPING